jgi:hypothetical protein
LKNKKTEGIILIICGLICIAAGLFVYFTAHTIYPDSQSTRVQDLNWLLKTFGKTGTALLFALPGIIALYSGWKRFLKS